MCDEDMIARMDEEIEDLKAQLEDEKETNLSQRAVIAELRGMNDVLRNENSKLYDRIHRAKRILTMGSTSREREAFAALTKV